MPAARPSTLLSFVFTPARPPASLCLLCMPVGLYLLCTPVGLCILFTSADLCLVFMLARPPASLYLHCTTPASASSACLPDTRQSLPRFHSRWPLPPLQARNLCFLCKPATSASSKLAGLDLPPLHARLCFHACPPLPIERFFLIIFFQSGDTVFFISSGLLYPLPLLCPPATTCTVMVETSCRRSASGACCRSWWTPSSSSCPGGISRSACIVMVDALCRRVASDG